MCIYVYVYIKRKRNIDGSINEQYYLEVIENLQNEIDELEINNEKLSEEINELNSVILLKDNVIEQKDNIIATKNREISSKNNTISQLNIEKQNLNTQINLLREELENSKYFEPVEYELRPYDLEEREDSNNVIDIVDELNDRVVAKISYDGCVCDNGDGYFNEVTGEGEKLLYPKSGCNIMVKCPIDVAVYKYSYPLRREFAFLEYLVSYINSEDSNDKEESNYVHTIGMNIVSNNTKELVNISNEDSNKINVIKIRWKMEGDNENMKIYYYGPLIFDYDNHRFLFFSLNNIYLQDHPEIIREEHKELYWGKSGNYFLIRNDLMMHKYLHSNSSLYNLEIDLGICNRYRVDGDKRDKITNLVFRLSDNNMKRVYFKEHGDYPNSNDTQAPLNDINNFFYNARPYDHEEYNKNSIVDNEFDKTSNYWVFYEKVIDEAIADSIFSTITSDFTNYYLI